MSRRIPLSRAAQLVGVKRRALQKQIQDGHIPSFDGTVEVSDLLRVYPDVQMHDNTQLERMERIMERSASKVSRSENALPDAHVLAARVNALAQDLVDAKTEANWSTELLAQIKQRIETIADDDRKAWQGFRQWLLGSLNRSQSTNDPSRQLLAQAQFLRTMTANVRVFGSEQAFPVEGATSILEAGLEAGVPLEFGCNDGTCGLCRARVTSGEVTTLKPHEYALSEAEKSQGYCLMCSCTPVTDLVIEAKVAGGPEDIPVQRILSKVQRIDPLSTDVTLLQLRTPRTRRLRFFAGQSVKLVINEDVIGEFPIASCPCDERHLEFHIPSHTDSPFSRYLKNQLKRRDEILIEGPVGQFVLDEASMRPLIMIAADTGFAPLKSITEHAMQLEHTEEIHFFWVINQIETHYLENLCRAWVDAFDGFSSQCMTGKTAFSDKNAYQREQEAFMKTILAQHDNIENYDIYIAGDAHFIKIAQALFVNVGFPKKQIFSGILP